MAVSPQRGRFNWAKAFATFVTMILVLGCIGSASPDQIESTFMMGVYMAITVVVGIAIIAKR